MWEEWGSGVGEGREEVQEKGSPTNECPRENGYRLLSNPVIFLLDDQDTKS
jgi:hypothetical protein